MILLLRSDDRSDYTMNIRAQNAATLEAAHLETANHNYFVLDAYGGYASYPDNGIQMAWNGSPMTSAANAYAQFQPGASIASGSAVTTIVNSDHSLKQHFTEIKPHLVGGELIEERFPFCTFRHPGFL